MHHQINFTMIQKNPINLIHYSVIRLSGKNTQTFLQGQLTCDMRPLSEHGKYSLAACCDHRGRMIANFWVANWFGDFIFILPKSMSPLVTAHLQKYAVFSKVTIEDQPHFIVIASEDIPFSANKGIFISLPNAKRFLWVSEQSYPDISDDESLWRANNIADGLAILYPETSLLFTPQMIHLQNLGGVSFEKGCYVGQEIIARTQYLGTLKRHLHRMPLSQSQLPKPGDTFRNDHGESVGVFVDAVQTVPGQIDALVVMQDRVI